MSNIFYFNINYVCNNNCIFCFSSSTGENENMISFFELKDMLCSVKPTESDKIVINGGEPTIHPDFYEMINYITDNFQSKIVIYSNGLMIDLDRIKKSKKLSFVIPFHGDAKAHNLITGNSYSFDSTLENVKNLIANDIYVSFKFILNKNLIERNFDIPCFLSDNGIYPSEIIIARMNETKKSRANHVEGIEMSQLIRYLENINPWILERYPVKFIDIPLCFLQVEYIDCKIYLNNVPDFYFSDYQNRIRLTQYYKQVKIGSNCNNCNRNLLCDILSRSYFTISHNRNWCLEIE